MKKLKFLIFIVFLGGAAFLFWQWQEDQRQTGGQLILYGNVDIREVHLAFRQPGRLAAMHYDEGDRVEKNTLLATLDDQPYVEALAVSQANVLLAQTELEKLQAGLRPQEVEQAQAQVQQVQAVALEAQRNHLRQQELVGTGVISQSVADTALAAHKEAQARLVAAQSALAQAQEGFRQEDIQAAQARFEVAKATEAQARTALADTRLLASSSGIILSRVREPGSMLASQSTVYILSLEEPVYVRAYVHEPQLGRIAPGSTVAITHDTSSKVYHGQVGFISPRAEFTPKTVETTQLRTDLVYRLRIVVKDADQGLRQGMPVTIQVLDQEQAPGQAQQ